MSHLRSMWLSARRFFVGRRGHTEIMKGEPSKPKVLLQQAELFRKQKDFNRMNAMTGLIDLFAAGDTSSETTGAVSLLLYLTALWCFKWHQEDMHSFHTYAYLVSSKEGMPPATYKHVLISIQHASYWASRSVKGYIYQANPELQGTVPTKTYSNLFRVAIAICVKDKLPRLCILLCVCIKKYIYM